MPDHVDIFTLSFSEVIQLLAKLEQSGELYEWIKKHFPKYAATDGTVDSFTLLGDLEKGWKA